MKTVCIKEILEKGTIGTSVIVRGWVRTKRESKAVTREYYYWCLCFYFWRIDCFTRRRSICGSRSTEN